MQLRAQFDAALANKHYPAPNGGRAGNECDAYRLFHICTL